MRKFHIQTLEDYGYTYNGKTSGWVYDYYLTIKRDCGNANYQTKIPTPYVQWVDLIGQERTPYVNFANLQNPDQWWMNKANIDKLFNNIPSYFSKKNNEVTELIYMRLLDTDSPATRHDLFFIFKDQYITEGIVAFFCEFASISNEAERMEKAKQKAYQQFDFNYNTVYYNNKLNEKNKSWWEDLLGSVVSAIPFIGGGLAMYFLGSKEKLSKLNLDLPGGGKLNYDNTFLGSMDLSTILIIGAGAGILLSVVKSKKGKRKKAK